MEVFATHILPKPKHSVYTAQHCSVHRTLERTFSTLVLMLYLIPLGIIQSVTLKQVCTGEVQYKFKGSPLQVCELLVQYLLTWVISNGVFECYISNMGKACLPLFLPLYCHAAYCSVL